MYLEEVHSSPIMENIPYKRNLVIQEEDHPSSYNIEEIFLMPSLSIFVERKSIGRESEV